MKSSWRRWCGLGFIFLMVSGCVGREIRHQAAIREAELSVPLPPPGPLALDSTGPYQVGIRVTEAVLTQMLQETLDKQIATAFSPKSIGVEEVMGFVPSLRARSTRLSLGGCSRCVSLEVRFLAELKAKPGSWYSSMLSKAAEYLKTEGLVRVKGRLATVKRESGPALTLKNLVVEEITLDGLISTQFSSPRESLSNLIEKSFDLTLADVGSDGPSIPLPSELTLGPDTLTLTAIGVDTTPASKGVPGELFVGFTTNLPAAGKVGIGTRLGQALAPGEWAVVVSKDVAEALLRRQLLAEGQVEQGRHFLLDLRGLSFQPEALHLDLRVWDEGRFAWWQDYQVTGALAIAEGRLVTSVVDIQPGEGKGFSWWAKRSGKAYDPSRNPIRSVVDLSNASFLWLEENPSRSSPMLTSLQLEPDRLTLIGGFLK